jgi:DNA uptake protein ComE-like DNA-binding protein
MYHLAEPYFPGNEKLQAKMRNLEDRIRVKRDEGQKHMSAPVASAPVSSLMAPLKADKKVSRPKTAFRDDAESEDDEFTPPPQSDHDQSFASEDSFVTKPKAARKPKKTAKKLPIFRDDHDSAALGEQTPRTSHLLKIINSRDVNQIKALKGVGSKKADAIVNCLMEMNNAEVQDLASLATLKGVSGKTVENMRMGLSVVGDYDF